MGSGRSKPPVHLSPFHLHDSQANMSRTRSPHLQNEFSELSRICDDTPGIFHNLSVLEMTRERLVTSEAEHFAARDYYSRLHYGCTIPYIVISAFLAVINVVFPSHTETQERFIRQASAMLNAFNAVLLGIGALMQFQTSMENHLQAAGQCAALKTECSQLEASLRMLAFGTRTHDTHVELGDFLRSFAGRIAQLHSKHQEIDKTCPVSDYFAKIATRRLAAMHLIEIEHAPMVRRHKEMLAAQMQNNNEVVRTLSPRSGPIRDEILITISEN